MGRRKSVIAAVILIGMSGSQSLAATDTQCVLDCTDQGYQYQYCVSRCSYATPGMTTPAPTTPAPSFPQPRQPHTDTKCVLDCTQRGYQYPFCVQQCTY
jgi:hypothetical protein